MGMKVSKFAQIRRARKTAANVKSMGLRKPHDIQAGEGTESDIAPEPDSDRYDDPEEPWDPLSLGTSEET